jgi:hypothetical protein
VRSWRHIAIGVGLFAFALALRLHFFNGFVLGDDPIEVPMLRTITFQGPIWNDQLHARFGGWLLNVLALKALGFNEVALFLPTILVSASFPVIAYTLMIGSGYGALPATLAGGYVASAPFEVVLGALRANDLFLAWFVALGALALLGCERRPVLQGILLAWCFWLSFYVKLWAVYFLPPLAVYYLARRAWRAAASFTAMSLVLHGATLLFWKAKVGTYLPFITTHAATYPIAARDLPRLFTDYSKLVFVGSDIATTLFGAVPYLWVGLVAAKVVARWLPGAGERRSFARWDRLDVLLLTLTVVFFLLLNFVPNGFKLDHYYSAPRIFRYLAPLSLPLTLHVAKMAIDLAAGVAPRRTDVQAALLVGLIGVNVFQAARATQPGREYRRVLLAIRDDLRKLAPPMVVAESGLSGWLQQLYMNAPTDRVPIMTAYHTYRAPEYEQWLDANQGRLPNGTILVTGFGGCIFYGASADGFRLRHFARPLSPSWTLVKEYPTPKDLPPDPPQLWRLDKGAVSTAATPPEPVAPVEGATADELFRNGMRHFDDNRYPQARAHFKAVIDRFPAAAEDARYFYAITFFRELRCEETIAAFEDMLRAKPGGRWTGAAHYHMGRCMLDLRRPDEARREFTTVVEGYANEPSVHSLAEQALREMPDARSLRARLIDWLSGWL